LLPVLIVIGLIILFVLITTILPPFSLAVQAIVNRTINLFSSGEKSDMSGLEILRGAVDMYHEEGEVEREHKNMFGGIIDLEDTDVEEVMHSRIPLWKDSPEKIVGILYTKDVFRATRNHNGDLANLDLKPLINKPWFVPESTMLKSQLNAFREKNVILRLLWMNSEALLASSRWRISPKRLSVKSRMLDARYRIFLVTLPRWIVFLKIQRLGFLTR